MDVRVLDVVKACNTPEQGHALFERVWPFVEKGEPIRLSFEGVSEITSSFANASIVRLVLKRDLKEIGSKVAIGDISKSAAEMIRRCVRNGLNQSQDTPRT